MTYITKTFLQPKNKVLTNKKTFIRFYILTKSVNTTLKTIPLNSEYHFNIKALTKAITDKTKVIYITNPNNPTNTYISKKEFDYLMEYIPSNILVILNKAYYEFAKDKNNYPDSIKYHYNNVITLRTFSKAYDLSGIRVRYNFKHEDLITNLTKVKLPFEPNLITQLKTKNALYDQPHLERTKLINHHNYVRLTTYLKEKNFNPIPSITNFVTIKLGSPEASDEMFNLLLNKNVIIRPLKANEMPEYVHISIKTTEEMDHFFEAMDKILPQYLDKYGSLL